jgi:hypothetical protein
MNPEIVHLARESRKSPPEHVVYKGHLNHHREALVTVSSGFGLYGLDLRLDLANHSPTGFAWGYGGSGPTQLALAILADALDDAPRALSLYRELKGSLTARLPQDQPWRMTRADVLQHVAELEASDPRLVQHAEQLREQMALDAAARAAAIDAEIHETHARHASFYG